MNYHLTGKQRHNSKLLLKLKSNLRNVRYKQPEKNKTLKVNFNFDGSISSVRFWG